MPVFVRKIGSRYSKSPLSCVEVVEATTIDFSCAIAWPGKKTAMPRNALVPGLGGHMRNTILAFIAQDRFKAPRPRFELSTRQTVRKPGGTVQIRGQVG